VAASTAHSLPVWSAEPLSTYLPEFDHATLSTAPSCPETKTAAHASPLACLSSPVTVRTGERRIQRPPPAAPKGQRIVCRAEYHLLSAHDCAETCAGAAKTRFNQQRTAPAYLVVFWRPAGGLDLACQAGSGCDRRIAPDELTVHLHEGRKEKTAMMPHEHRRKEKRRKEKKIK
jgi:hypothetical protein